MWYVILGVILLAADQSLKLWTMAAFSPPAEGFTATSDAAIPVLSGLLDLTRVHNSGAAWSSFAGQRWLLLIVTSVIVAVVLWALLTGRIHHPMGRLAGVLIATGGVGNIIDRVRLGYVIDMVHLAFWPDYPVFNVADICVVTGAILGAIYFIGFEKTKERADGQEDSAGE